MDYVFDFSKQRDLQIVCSTPEEQTVQELYCLLNTTIAEVPCYREFGLDKSFMHSPQNIAQTLMVAAISEAIENFMPQLKVKKFAFDVDPEDPASMAVRLEVLDNE